LRCAVSAARSGVLTMTNFARSSLALVLRAFFGGAKSCAFVNIFMICPPMVGWWLADHDQISCPWITAISWLSNRGLGSKIQPAVMAKAPASWRGGADGHTETFRAEGLPSSAAGQFGTPGFGSPWARKGKPRRSGARTSWKENQNETYQQQNQNAAGLIIERV